MVFPFSSASDRTRKRYSKLAGPMRIVGEQRHVDIDGYPLAFWEAGRGGRAIVFLHGNSACKEIFAAQMVAAAERGYRAIAIDLPGHGDSADSASPQKDYELTRTGTLVLRLLMQLGLERPLVVGWSLGGHLALEMLGRAWPLRGVAIAGTPPCGPGADEMLQAFKPSDAMALTGAPEFGPSELETYLGALYGRAETIPPAFRAAAARTDGVLREVMFTQFAVPDRGCHAHTVIAGSATPICVVHGSEECFFDRAYLAELQWRALWQDRIFDIEGAGHCPFFERPQACNDILFDFAAAVFGPEPGPGQ